MYDEYKEKIEEVVPFRKYMRAPPDWVFWFIWSGLYTLMGAASYRVVKHGGGCEKQKIPMAMYSEFNDSECRRGD